MTKLFDRKSFNPEDDPHDRKVLNILRSRGGKRFFTRAWETWTGVTHHSPTKTSCLEMCPLGAGRDRVLIDAGCGDSPDADIWTDEGGIGIGYDLFPRKEKIELPISPSRYTLNRTSQFKIQDICERWPNEDRSVDVILSHAVLDLMDQSDRFLFYVQCERVLKGKNDDSLLIIKYFPLSCGYGTFKKNHDQEVLEEAGLETFTQSGLIFAWPKME
jgi:hypothetical protein